MNAGVCASVCREWAHLRTCWGHGEAAKICNKPLVIHNRAITNSNQTVMTYIWGKKEKYFEYVAANTHTSI